MYELIDSHCHLDHATRGGADGVDDVIARARAAGVVQMITIGATSGLAHNPEAIRLAEAYDFVFAAVGVHPHDAAKVPANAPEVVRPLAEHTRCVAVGEIGLDYHYDNSPRDVQREVFARFVQLAREVGKPISVHTREADQDTLDILTSEGAREVGGVIHCFSHSLAFGRAMLDLGFKLSIPGIVTFANAADLRETVKQLPLEDLMVETDTPFLTPVPHRGTRNEPAFVLETVRAIAALKGMPVADVAAATTRAARSLFRLPEPHENF